MANQGDPKRLGISDFGNFFQLPGNVDFVSLPVEPDDVDQDIEGDARHESDEEPEKERGRFPVSFESTQYQNDCLHEPAQEDRGHEAP